MGILWVNPSIQMDGLGGIFQDGENISMVEVVMEEYSLASIEVAYEDPW